MDLGLLLHSAALGFLEARPKYYIFSEFTT